MHLNIYVLHIAMRSLSFILGQRFQVIRLVKKKEKKK